MNFSERTLGTFFLLLPSHYKKPKNFIFKKNLEIIDYEEKADDDDNDEDEEEYVWGSKEIGFGYRDFNKKKRGHYFNLKYYSEKQSCLYENLYARKNNTNKCIK